MRTYSPGENFEAPALDRAGIFRFATTRGLLFFIASSSVQIVSASTPAPSTAPHHPTHRGDRSGQAVAACLLLYFPTRVAPVRREDQILLPLLVDLSAESPRCSGASKRTDPWTR